STASRNGGAPFFGWVTCPQPEMTIGSLMWPPRRASRPSAGRGELQHEAMKELDPGAQAGDRDPCLDAVCAPCVRLRERDGTDAVGRDALRAKEAGIRAAEGEDGDHGRG